MRKSVFLSPLLFVVAFRVAHSALLVRRRLPTITVIYTLVAECKKCLALIFAASIILGLILSDLIPSSFSFSSVSALDLMAVR
jgi:hypothetical protein